MIQDEDEREECVRTRKYMNMYNNPILAVAQPHRLPLVSSNAAKVPAAAGILRRCMNWELSFD